MDSQNAWCKLYADIARAYFMSKKVYRYHMKKISDMDDGEVVQKCHWWYEENNLVDEYRMFEDDYLNQMKQKGVKPCQ